MGAAHGGKSAAAPLKTRAGESLAIQEFDNGNGLHPAGGKRRPMAEINMTPLVDVMLVLLVIFMVTAPMLDKTGVDVQLPKADGSKTGTGKAAVPWSLTIDTTGHVYVSGKKLEPAEVATQLPALLKGHDKDILTINGDGRLSYETVMRVVAIIHKSGVDKINLAVQGMKP